MGKGRKPGILSAGKKIHEIRNLIEQYNKPLAKRIGFLHMEEALVEIHIAYSMDPRALPPQDLNEACRRLLARVRKIHSTEIAEFEAIRKQHMEDIKQTLRYLPKVPTA